MTFDTGNRNEGQFLGDVHTIAVAATQIADLLTGKGEPRFDALPEPDTDAMNLIRDLISGAEWSPDILGAIAQIVRHTGRTVAEYEEG